MIDIIICVNNENNFFSKCLASVAFQTYKDIKVIVVDSTLSDNVSKTLELFKDKIDYLYIKSDKVGNMSYLRNLGIKNSHGKYVMFLDEKDVIHDIYSLERLVNKGNNSDIITGSAIYYNNKVISNNIYGKLYSKNFLEKYDLRFNESLELDTVFNIICIFCTSNITTIKDIVYFRNENDEESFAIYNLNMHYLISEGRRRKCKEEELDKLLYSTIIYDYYDYLSNSSEDNIRYAARLYKLFEDSKLSIDERNTIFNNYRGNGVIPSITIDEYFEKLKNV